MADSQPTTIRSGLVWTHGATTYIAFGACSKLLVAISGNDRSDLKSYTFRDITPAGQGIGTALDDPTPRVGFGRGTFGSGLFGRESSERSSDMQPITTWSFDLWGSHLIACPSTRAGDVYGAIYQWDPGSESSAKATIVENAPTGCIGILSMLERFIFALGKNADAKVVSWCDRENLTVWDSLPENEAGDFDLGISGDLIQGVTFQSVLLLLSSKEAVVCKYQAAPFVFGFKTVNNNCGVVSGQSAVKTPIGPMWMGREKIHWFDGVYVRELNCDLKYELENNINFDFASKIHSAHVDSKSEAVWFYPSSGSTEIDRYISYNYETQAWCLGESDRTAYLESGIFANPIGIAKNGDLYWHEKLNSYDENNLPFAETGPIYLNGNDGRSVEVLRLIPDLQKDQDGLTFRLIAGNTPQGEEYFVPGKDDDGKMVNPVSGFIDLRNTGKYIRFRVDGKDGKDWSLGNIETYYGLRGNK